MSSDLKQANKNLPKPAVSGICADRLEFEMFLGLVVFLRAEHWLSLECLPVNLCRIYDKCLLKLHIFYNLCTKP